MQLLHPALAAAPRPDRKRLQYDLDAALAAVVRLHVHVDEHCVTASTLGAEREGAGIVIDDNGLILTIGYLIVEARDVTPAGPGQRAGLRRGDAVLAIEGVPVDTLPDLYRTLWAAGEAGVEIRYTVLRNDDVITIRVTTGDRYAFLDLPQRH